MEWHKHLLALRQVRSDLEMIQRELRCEVNLLYPISHKFPTLDYLRAQQSSLDEALAHVEKAWDRAFDQLYSLDPETRDSIIMVLGDANTPRPMGDLLPLSSPDWDVRRTNL